MKQSISTGLLCFFILLLCSCQSDDPFVSDDEISSSVSIYLASGFSNPGNIGVTSLEHAQGMIYDRIRAFQQQHSAIKIEFDEYNYLGGSSFPKKFPDVIEITPFQIRWVAEDELEELHSTVSSWSGAYGTLVERTKVEGSSWMLPLKIEPMVAFYDEDIISHLGIQAPHDDWTWHDFLTIARQLNDNGYQIKLPDTFEAVEPIIKGLGGSYISPDGSKFTDYLNSDVTIEAFEQYIGSTYEFRANESNNNEPPVFGIAWPSELYSVLKENPDIRITRLPVFPDGNRHNTMFTTGLVIHREALDKSIALELMKAILEGDDQQLLHFVNTHALTARESRFRIDPPEQLDSLLDVMGMESLVATPSILQLNAGVIFPSYYGALYQYREMTKTSFHDIYPSMLEEDSVEPILNHVADFIDMLYPTQRGNWDSY